MKQCPQCNQAYSDDTLRYCLADGTPLVGVYSAAEEPTVVLPSPAQAPITNKVTVGGVHSLFKYLAAALAALLLLAAGGGIAVFLMWPKDDRAEANNSERKSLPTQSPTQTNVARIPAAQPSRTPAVNVNSQDPPEPPAPKRTPPRPIADRGLTRITFGKGRIGETISGDLNRKRDFVLRTLAGQSLTATVRSPNGCAVFDDGNSSASFATSTGDTFLQVRNTCDEPTQFSLTVTVR